MHGMQADGSKIKQLYARHAAVQRHGKLTDAAFDTSSSALLSSCNSFIAALYTGNWIGTGLAFDSILLFSMYRLHKANVKNGHLHLAH